MQRVLQKKKAASASSPSLPLSASQSSAGSGRRHAATLYHHKSTSHNVLTATTAGNSAAPPRDQVVVGLSASIEDEVEDWSSDFLTSEPRSRWRRKESVGTEFLLAETLYKRRSSSSSNGVAATGRNRRGSEVAASSGSSGSVRHSGGNFQAEEDDRALYNSYSSVKDTARTRTDQPEDASDSDEDWDAEFGFEEQADAALGSSDSMDPTRRRAENGNFFLPNLHEVLDGETLPDDDEADVDGVSFNLDGAQRRRRLSDEPLFQRRRSDLHQSGASVDGSVDGIRSSLTSASASSSNAMEYSLVDKLRLLEVANSSAYAVRIERYPKPSSTFSNLERDRSTFPSFTENKYERWLADLVVPDCAVVSQHMETERGRLPPPRQLKNQQFHALVSLPFGREFVDTFFKQITHYRFFGEDKENRELVRMYFEKVSTTGMTDENWAKNLSPVDLDYVVGCSIDVLQEAARLYGPKPVVPLATHLSLSMLSTSSSASSQGNKTTIYWIQQFQDILLHCAEAFPQYSNVVALIELRYVCHHLAGFASGEYEYKWQICNQLPAFLPLEPVVGDSASHIVNEVLQYYGALFQYLNTSPESRSTRYVGHKSPSNKRISPFADTRQYALSSDVFCLQALIMCDIQSLYDSKSALAEISLPALEELLEFEDDEATVDPILVGLMPHNRDSRSSSSSSNPDYRDSAYERGDLSKGLGGWSASAKLFELLRPSSRTRNSALSFFYERISAAKFPLVKAKCATVLAAMHVSSTTSHGNLRVAESLAYEAVRLLEACSKAFLARLTRMPSLRSRDKAVTVPYLSIFNNDGLLSDLGREALESLGNVLIKNNKYRYGILCLEAAGALFSFLNQGCEYEKLDRLLCKLTLEADDVHRALPLHEKVTCAAQRQGNITVYVYLTQEMTKLWIREGNFTRAEEYLATSCHFLRDHTNLLPPHFLSSVINGSYSSSEAPSSRSGTMMTATSSSVSSSLSGSFHLSSRSTGNASEVDTWLNHDINLHLLVRDVYRSSGRCLEGMRVLEHLLNYSSRLPRGKRTQLRMLLAEDALKMRMFDTCRHMFSLMEREATAFCDRLQENIKGFSGPGSSSGTGPGTSSSGGGRSLGGMGSEARYCFDMSFTFRYIVCRVKLYLKLGDFCNAYAWLSLAHVKNDRDNVRKQAQLYVLDGKVLRAFCREQQERERELRRDREEPSRRGRVGSTFVGSVVSPAQVDEMLKPLSVSLYGLNKEEKQRLNDRMVQFATCVRDIDKAEEQAQNAFWTAFDLYRVLDDSLYQLKVLLEVVAFMLAPVQRSFFALGSNQDDEMLKSHLRRRSSGKGSSGALELEDLGGDDTIEKTRKTLLEAQKLLRPALNLAEQVANPACFLRTLIFCSEVWVWLERIASYKSEKHLKEATAFWEEAVRIMKGVFFRRVAFHDVADAHMLHSSGFGNDFSTPYSRGLNKGRFCVVPILNFSEGFIVKLEEMTLQLILAACQLQQFERVPEYVEETLLAHLDELLSARLCLSSIVHQLQTFRALQKSHKRLPPSGSTANLAAAAAVPSGSSMSVSSVGSSNSRSSSFSAVIPVPSPQMSGSGKQVASTPSPSGAGVAVKRAGHKKNQSMSSISELLASNAPSPYQEGSASYCAPGGLKSSATPRTGLASLSERPNVPPPSTTAGKSGTTCHNGHKKSSERKPRRYTRERSRSAPQPAVPNYPSPNAELSFSQAGDGHPHDGGGMPVVAESGESSDGSLKRTSSVKFIDLGDLRSLPPGEDLVLGRSDGFGRDEGSSSNGAIGLCDFDEVQSEKLWWIFNLWRDAKAKYVATWKCTYEVEAYYLMRATFSSAEEPPPVEKPALDLEKVEEEEGERVEDDFLHVFGEPAQRQRMNPLRDVNYELDEARAAGQRRGLYEATNSSLYYLSVSPFLTLHNRLATAMAYRLLNGSLQLIAEGILAVGNVLPLFQVDASEVLYVSFRLENYNWSAPKLIINPKTSAYTVPYKDMIEPVPLLGRTFDRDITGEQSSVPNLQLQVKLSGRDVIVFCSIWIVNHTDLDLEYCNSTSSSSKRLETALKYVQLRAGSAEYLSDDFSARSLSFHGEGGRDTQLTRLHKVKPSANPVAVIVVIREAKELYNAQYFGAQSPYVRASLYVLKNPKDRYLEKPEMVAICSATTKPSPSGGLAPQWDARLQNTLLLRFPPEVRTLDLARIIIEVRNVRYGLDTCLGVTAVKVDSILKDRKRAAAFNWYKLLKRKSSRERKASKNNLASVHRGDISMSFSVGTSQELPSDIDVAESVEEVVEDSSQSFHDEEAMPSFPQRQESEGFELDDLEASSVLDGQRTSGPLPSTSAARSMQRLQTPSSHDAGLIGVPASMRARQAYTFSGEAESTRAQELLSYDPTSTRAMGALLINGSPTKPAHTGKAHGVQVYLPHNRFACVVIEVYPSSLMSEVFDLVCMKCGFVGVLDIDDFDFYELALPRFVSLRSAGRPEGERWYGQPIPMISTIENKGRRHGLHLCHRITMTTLRLYDETSTASSHHATPRSLVTSSKRSNPAQTRPMPWGDVLPYSSGGKHWDVLRIKSRSSPWSDVIRLNRNAMGNSGVAQVISLTNEVYDQDQESELRKGSQEVALWSCYGSGRFSETIMATVVPRYILINKTEETIKYRQFDVPQTFRLAANDLVPFHWPSASREKLLEVSVLHKYSWSGSFRINSLGTTYLKLRDRADSSRIYILQCQIELVGGSVALIFREESKRFPPYRIDNMTSFRIRYKQTNWGDDKDFDELLPRSSCAYSWDYLNGSDGKSSSSSNQDPAFPGSSSSSSRSLQVRFMRVTSSTSKTGGDSDKDAVEIREYNLDEMATHKRIQLHRSLPSELFLKPEQKGYLLKKDSMLKWNRKYFRLYEHMLYYFANETDQELLGVVDLRTGSDVPGVGGVAIFEKAAEAPSKSGFISLNGLVSSISGSLFGGGSKQLGKDGDDDDDDGDDRSRELVRFAVSLTTSSVLCEESEKFVNAHIESGTSVKSGVSRKGFYVNGQDLVDFLVTEMSTQTKAQAFTTAQEMMELGVLKPIQITSDAGAHKQAPLRSFQCSKIVWYSVDSINLADDSDLDSEDSSSITTPRDVEQAVASSKSKPPVVGSNQFSIITPTKCYDLKAKNPKIAKIWVRRLRLATQGGAADDIEDLPEETPMAGASLVPKTMRSQRDFVPQVQNAKTYVHVRIRADGPTKVLELFEGGEEDFDEKESKYELSSTTSASSGSPTTSETSTNAFESLTSGMALHLRMDGVGISCVNELPMELVYIYLGGISLHYSRVNSNMRMNITLDDLQIDNQSEEATFTKLLCPRMENGVAAATTPTRKRTVGDIDEDLAEMVNQGRGTGGPDNDSEEGTGLISNQNIFSCADCKYRQANVAAMHFCCTWSNEQGNTDYFKHCSFWLYPVITQLDEELLVSARAFMASMSQSWGENRSQNRGGEIRLKSIPIETMMESLSEYRENTLSDELNPLQSLKSYTTTSSSETRKVYFALLHIHPMDFDITFRSDVFQTSTTISLHEAASFKKAKFSGSHADEMKRSSSAPSLFSDSSNDDSSSTTWTIPSLTMHVPDLDNAPVRLNALMIEHAFGTSGDLTRRVSKYYTRQLWKQLHKILGSFDFLGNPVGFLDHIGTGVRDFVYEPLEGLKIGGKGFSKGLAKGTASLMSNTVDGTFDAASKISGTFGQGFANLSLDDHYQQNRARARRRHVRGLREGLVQGSRELSLGVYEGVSGLVLNPMRGAQESGAVGFVRGTITGIIGLPVKPVAGIFDFASRATQGVRNRSLQNGQNMRRVRRPRVFGRYNELKCYKEADTIAYEMLKKVGGERLSGEKIIFYNEIMQYVSAADLTREARDRRRSGSIGNGKSKSNDSTRERTNSLRRALQEDDERRRAAGEPLNSHSGESSGRKLRYEVVFYQKKLGMDLETDFYCENVTIKAMDETARSKAKVRGQIAAGQEVLQEGDCLIGVGGVDVRGIGFHETLALLRGTTRPITVQFESAEELMQEAPTPKPDNTGDESDLGTTSRARLRRLSLAGPGVGNDAENEAIKKIKVQLSHWLIVTEQRVLYINVGSFSKPVVEWMTPLRYIYRVEWQKSAAQISLHLSVGVDSLPMGPRLRPSLKAIDGHERDMNVFLDVMWHSFGSTTAEEQELWPSDTSLNGYLLKKGGFSTVRRWFVLSRNCLYYFSSRKQLRGIIPLGHVRLETDAGDARCLRITNATRSQPLVTLQLDSGQVVERVQSEVVLVASSTQELEMWQSSLAHAAGKGMRHSRGTRFFVPTAASRLEIGTQETPDFVVKPLAEALNKTVEVFNNKLP